MDTEYEDEDDFADATMDKKFDWIITADTMSMKNFLNYPTSGLHPVSKVKINYRLTSRFDRQRDSYAPVLYEELWYHDCRPIGCRKVNQLEIEAGQLGALHFKEAKDIYANHCAVANVTARILLDAGLKQAMLSCVIVPAEIFDQVKSDLGQFNFFPYEIRPDTGIPATMNIYLTSQPKGREASLFYFKN